jgi:hypothetical protein
MFRAEDKHGTNYVQEMKSFNKRGTELPTISFVFIPPIALLPSFF